MNDANKTGGVAFIYFASSPTYQKLALGFYYLSRVPKSPYMGKMHRFLVDITAITPTRVMGITANFPQSAPPTLATDRLCRGHLGRGTWLGICGAATLRLQAAREHCSQDLTTLTYNAREHTSSSVAAADTAHALRLASDSVRDAVGRKAATVLAQLLAGVVLASDRCRA